MENESSRPFGQRILDIAIASLIGAVLGATFASHFHPGLLSVGMLQADSIRVPGEMGEVVISRYGISLERHDYANIRLGYDEPGTGGKGGPSIWITGTEHQAFKATPSGQEVVHFKHDERDGP
jgi:hypothetical protein